MATNLESLPHSCVSVEVWLAWLENQSYFFVSREYILVSKFNWEQKGKGIDRYKIPLLLVGLEEMEGNYYKLQNVWWKGSFAMSECGCSNLE